MALKLKYTDEHGILHINMSPTSTPRVDPAPPNPINNPTDNRLEKPITDPKFDSINTRFAQYDLFGGKYDVQPTELSGGEEPSLFRSRYNSIEEELANTPYAFTGERNGLNSLNNRVLDITIKSRGDLDDASPSKDIEDDRFFNRNSDDLFGPVLDEKSPESDSPAFTVTQLIHAQDRYFDLSSRQSSSSKNSKSESVKSLKSKFEFRSAPSSANKDKRVTIVGRVRSGSGDKDEAFTVLPSVKAVREVELTASLPSVPVPTSKRKRESSFAIITETPVTSRPSSPASLPAENRSGRVSPFKGRGFREETSRHSTPHASTNPSRTTSPTPLRYRTPSEESPPASLRYRTSSVDGLDKMAATTMPPLHHTPHSPRNFVKQNIEEVRELSELNREMHEAEAERKRREEEEALLKEMEEFEKGAKSVVGSRSNSRSNSPGKVKLRSRSNSPAAILHFENIPDAVENGVVKPERKSRLRSVSKSQPQSNNGSPKHSKIPKRQNSVSPSRSSNQWESSTRPVENNLSKNQRFISSSTSSINDTIKLGSSVHDKRAMSKSTQQLSISPKHIKGKPPISPGRYGPPPSNKAINAKRLSPIVGTPNKSPTEDPKPNSARTPTKPSSVAKKPAKTAGNTPATSRFGSRQPSRSVSRDPSPDKRRNPSSRSAPKPISKPSTIKPVNRTPSTRNTVKPKEPVKNEVNKSMNRTSSMKSLIRTPSTKNLNGKPPLKKGDSKKDLKEKAQSTSSINEVGSKKEAAKEEKKTKDTKRDIDLTKKDTKAKDVDAKSDGAKLVNGVKTTETTATESTEEISKQDIQTQFDSITNEKGELIIMTKKNVVSMTTAAITSQPLEVVTAVTNQLPAALEKAREKAMFERHGSKDSLAPKENDAKDTEDKTADDKKSSKSMKDDSMKMKLMQPPYNNPQVERARQKIEDILKSPEVSTENILTPEPKPETKPSFKSFANKAKTEMKETKIEIANKFTDIKDQAMKQNTKMENEIRSEATKIVNSIITPVEEPTELKEPRKEEAKTIDPIVTVVNEKKTPNGPKSANIVVKTTETLVKGEPDVEVQSSNMSTPVNKMAAQNKMADGSDKSTSNGGFPQSTSTTPKPPTRAHRSNQSSTREGKTDKETTPENEPKKQNICQRLLGKCAKKSNCCGCCVKPEDEDLPAMVKEVKDEVKEEVKEKKEGMISKFNCCKKKEAEEKMVKEIEQAAGKVSLDFENEAPRTPKRKLANMLCCRGRRVSDVSEDLAEPMTTGCCGRRRPVVERRDSILSDRPPTTCCNNRLFNWMRGACRRRSEHSSSRRPSLFSKNKSLSPTLPPEDTRPKLDPSLVEHTSVIRGAIPVLPPALAWLCLVCNVVVPGLGTIFSGLFCLCFGIPRFGAHDGAKYRIGAFVTNLFVGCGQLFTVLFCLVGWGWSIWWGVIMLRVSRKYRKLRAEAAAEEDQQQPPVTTNNHTRA